MAGRKSHFDAVQGEIIGAVRAGASIADAARRSSVSDRTVKRWMTMGRQQPGTKYAEFVEAVEQARTEVPSGPMSAEELREVVSQTARKGSVQAMKLLWEIIRADQNSGEEEAAPPKDPLRAVDELASRRTARTG